MIQEGKIIGLIILKIHLRQKGGNKALYWQKIGFSKF